MISPESSVFHSITFLSLFSSFFALFKLAGWPTRAIIARGSQWVPKDIVAISLPRNACAIKRMKETVLIELHMHSESA